ncbi:diguanylate cyclase [Gordonia sp. N1V]|uniref:sensor domain-containing diguanylate cyclase n=1 Tax=Gordonia sp. N1V TaxID=3034163 RepID=UPI0023E33069|nr:diguanylate cyclase [Gordonia sp. N1V]MDF3285044.1 diguanylate cyclase [Gordonia sp. N1V]
MAGKQNPEGPTPSSHEKSQEDLEPGVADRYQLLVELSPDAIAVHQMGVVVWVNSAALRFARHSSIEEMVGKPITDYVHPDSLPAMLDRLSSMGEHAGAHTGPDDVVMRDSHGNPRYMQVTSVLTSWDGAPAYQVILRDITVVRRQAALINHVSDAVISVSDDGVVLTWNPAAESLYGIASEDAIGRPLTELRVMGEVHGTPAAIGQESTVDSLHQRADTGAEFSVRSSVTRIDDGYLIIVHSLRTPLVRRLGTMLASLHQSVLLVEDSGDGARVEMANPAAITMLDLKSDDIPKRSLDSLALDFPGGATPIAECLRSGIAFDDMTATITRADGSTDWCLCSGRRIDEEDEPPVVLVSIVDVTTHHREVSDLAWQATHDHLTGALNRPGLLAAIDDLLATIAPHQQVALYYLDLDGFKLVNDTRGHMIGDQVLQVVARRLKDTLSPSGVIGRIGGDEFVVCAKVAGDDLEPIATRIAALQAVVATPIEVNGQAEHVSVSVGVATTRGIDQATAESLLAEADMSLYETRKTSRQGLSLRERHDRPDDPSRHPDCDLA